MVSLCVLVKVRLSKFVDYFLIHNREIINRVDDSVVRLTDNKPVFLGKVEATHQHG